MMFILTMVFQALEALTILPLAITDAAKDLSSCFCFFFTIIKTRPTYTHLQPTLTSASRFFCRDVSVGDIVTVGECRPLSKTVRFNVLKVTKAAGAKKQFQKF